MAKPNPVKDQKPQEEAANLEKKAGIPSATASNLKFLLLNLTTTSLLCIIFIITNFIIQNHLSADLLNVFKQTSEEALLEENKDEDTPQKGLILDLGDFTLNLADVSPRAFLKVNVAIEVSKKEEELNQEAGGGEKPAEGHGGEGEAASPAKGIEEEFAQYKPSLRDAVITVLSSKTSEELSTTTGKELVKEQLTEAINAVFDGEREVLRVSFGDFIMQQGR